MQKIDNEFTFCCLWKTAGHGNVKVFFLSEQLGQEIEAKI